VHNHKPSSIQRYQKHLHIWMPWLRSHWHKFYRSKAWRTNKIFELFVPGSARSPSPIILDMVIEEICAILTPPKRFRIQCIILPLGSAENSEKCTPRLNPHNSETPWTNAPKFKLLTQEETAHKPSDFRNRARDMLLRDIYIPKISKNLHLGATPPPSPNFIPIRATCRSWGERTSKSTHE